MNIDFKGFTNRWLGKACQNGGSIPVQMEQKVEKQIIKHKEYMKQAEERSATPEEISEILSGFKNKMKADK